MDPLTPIECQTNGITYPADTMPNGEQRYRLMDTATKAGYILTKAGDHGGWQNAHYHKKLTETYIVQSGWILFASIDDQKTVRTEKIMAGAIKTVSPNYVHNIYVPAHSIIHTVKHGDTALENDWFANDYLDHFCKKTFIAVEA